MSTTDYTLPLNQTSDFIETTDVDNQTYRNYSDTELELQSKSKGSLVWWVDIEIYRYTYWAIVLCICLVGVTGNILVFIMMGEKKLKYMSYSVYLKFLAVSDSCLLIARLVNETKKTLMAGYPDDFVFCVASFTVRNLVMFLSPWLVVGLTFDRYVCVCFPLTRDKVCTRKKAIAICSAITLASVCLVVPFPLEAVSVNGKCVPTESLNYYFILFRVLLSSFLPCLFILILNIIITSRIRRSFNFRSMFTRSRSSSTSTNREQDSSIRPLVIVSVMAFVTMLPVGVSEAVKSYLLQTKGDREQRVINSNIWSGLFIIYLLNFGQNFYILIASSANYRQIIRKRLGCYNMDVKQANRGNHVIISNVRLSVAGSGLESTSFTEMSATSRENDKEIDVSQSVTS